MIYRRLTSGWQSIIWIVADSVIYEAGLAGRACSHNSNSARSLARWPEFRSLNTELGVLESGVEMANVDHDLEAYRQANADLRHFSALRFTVLGAFVAISSGLFVLAVQYLKETHVNDFSATALFAVAVALAFLVFELRINALAEFYAAKVDGLARELGMSLQACSAPRKSSLGAWLAPLVMLVVYGGSIAIWIHALLN